MILVKDVTTSLTNVTHCSDAWSTSHILLARISWWHFGEMDGFTLSCARVHQNKKSSQRQLEQIGPRVSPDPDSVALVHQRISRQHQRISSISASAGSVHQQDQRISRISASAGSAHQQDQRISRIGASAGSAHQQDWCISRIGASAGSTHQ